MPLLPAVPHLRLILKHEYLFALSLLDYVGYNPGSLYSRRAQRDLLPVGYKMNSIQLDGLAAGRKFRNVDCLSGRYLVLLAPGFNYSVNIRPPNLTYLQILSTHAPTVKLLSARCTAMAGAPRQFGAVPLLSGYG